MASIGLRELRQDASGVVRRVEGGESIEVTVSGRPVARLVPAGRSPWRRWAQVAEVFSGPPDEDWARERELLDDDPRDPWRTGG